MRYIISLIALCTVGLLSCSGPADQKKTTSDTVSVAAFDSTGAKTATTGSRPPSDPEMELLRRERDRVDSALQHTLILKNSIVDTLRAWNVRNIPEAVSLKLVPFRDSLLRASTVLSHALAAASIATQNVDRAKFDTLCKHMEKMKARLDHLKSTIAAVAGIADIIATFLASPEVQGVAAVVAVAT